MPQNDTNPESQTKVKGALISANGRVNQIYGFYQIEKRLVTLGRTDNLDFEAISPDKKIFKDDWTFDILLTLKAQNLSFLFNMVSLS